MRFDFLRVNELSFFIFLKLFSSMFLLILNMLGIVLVTRVLRAKQRSEETIMQLVKQMDQVFSFVRVTDSRFIGLFVFLISNVLTGLVNLSINTLSTSDTVAVLVLLVYCLASFGVPFLVYFFSHSGHTKSA
jgi:hypothetical protein